MNLLNYIQGKRYGKEAYDLEREAMQNPFLQDAIDGYDQVNDRPVYHLKKLKKQMAKQGRNYFYNIRPWSIIAGILVIIFISLCFFLLDSNKEDPQEKTAYIKPLNMNASVSNNDKKVPGNDESVPDVEESVLLSDSLVTSSVETNKIEVINEPLPPPITEEKQLSSLRERRRKLEENRVSFQNRIYENPSNNTLSDSEIRAILSGFKQNNATPDNLFQRPKPAVGEAVYKSYIERVRIPLNDGDCEVQHGKVILLFNVNAEGRPVDICILRSLCPVADREAIWLLQNGPDWTVSNNSARLEITF